MCAEENPYQPPRPLETSPPSYVMTPYRPRFWNSWFGDPHARLQEALNRVSAEGRRFAAYYTVGSDHYLILTWSDAPAPEIAPLLEYKVAPWPRVATLLKQPSGDGSEFLARHFPECQIGWRIVGAAWPNNVVLARTESADDRCQYSEFQWVRVPPNWWRTLWGWSWLRQIGNQLNVYAADGFELVAYAGDDAFLLARRAGPPNPPKSYCLEVLERYERMIYRDMASVCTSWFNRMWEEGWEVKAHHHGAVFLFSRREGF